MREFITNFQKKHGQQVPMPKIYGDEDSSDSEGLELANGTRVGRKTTGGAGSSGGGKPRKKAATSSGTNTGGGDGASTSGAGRSGGGDRVEAENEAGTTMVMMMTLTSAGRQGVRVDPQDRLWLVRNYAKGAQLTPRLTEGCQSSTSLAQKREPCWATACWTGLWCRRRRYMRRGCRGGK